MTEVLMGELPADFSFLDSPDIKRVVVGLSGGVDSIVLLDLLADTTDLPVVALHVNHHLHDRADAAADFCLSLESKYSITVEVLDVEVSESGSMETRAREARYSAFSGFLEPGDVLLLAHHADDQVETALFRLFRGSRVFGLEGMPVKRSLGSAALHRPLLAAGRDQIQSYAASRQLTWFEDPTNADLTPDRNFIRHELLPLIESRFPVARKSILAAVAGDERAREQLYVMMLARLEDHMSRPDELELEWLGGLSRLEIVDLLSAWMMRLKVPQPSGRFLNEIADKIASAQLVDDVFGEFCLHSFHDRLYLSRRLPDEKPEVTSLAGHLRVPGGHIDNDNVKGRGLRANRPYEIRYRSGGEKITVRVNRSLKTLFQEQAVPPWLRDRVPLVYDGDKLVATAGLPDWGLPMLVADGHQAESGESGLEISLHLNDRVNDRVDARIDD